MKTLLEMFISVKNAQLAGLDRITIPFSKLKMEAAKVLKEEKYIGAFERTKKKLKKAELPFIEIEMAYKKEGVPAMNELKFFSKPSRHIYLGTKDIRKYKGGFETLILSTSRGLMTDKEAIKNKIGGEIIAGIN